MSEARKFSQEESVTRGQAGSPRDAEAERELADELLAATVSMIKHRITVMGGKGGVGKSTVAVNLAAALATDGRQVGIMDADVHGPDVPMMFGLEGQHPESASGYLLPLIGPKNIRVMSMSFLIGSRDTPIAWRGPLKHRLFQQFLTEVEWGPLDYLVVDLPPGTGDEPLSVAQLLGKPMSTVIVTTPQDVALLDSRKAVVFAREMEMDVLGIIENMSGLECPHCGRKIDLFKVGGGEKAAQELGVPFLGRIPIDPDVVTGGDAGVPIVFKSPDSKTAKMFKELALNVDKTVSNNS